MEPFDVVDAGRTAFAADSQGTVFGLGQGREHIGAQFVGEPFAYAWAELLTTDIVASQSVYTAVFGWKPQEVGDDPGFLYRMQVVGERPVGGIFQVDELLLGLGRLLRGRGRRRDRGTGRGARRRHPPSSC